MNARAVGLNPLPPPQRTFGRLIEDFTADATGRCGEAEAKSLRSVTGRIQRALGGLGIEDVTDSVRQAYLDGLASEGLSQRYVGNHKKVLGRIFKFGVERGLARSTASERASVIPLVALQRSREGAPVLLERRKDGPSSAVRSRRGRTPKGTGISACKDPLGTIGSATPCSPVGHTSLGVAQPPQPNAQPTLGALKPNPSPAPRAQMLWRAKVLYAPIGEAGSFLKLDADEDLLSLGELLQQPN